MKNTIKLTDGNVHAIINDLNDAKQSASLQLSSFDNYQRQQPNETNTDFVRRLTRLHHESWIISRINNVLRLLEEKAK